MPWILALFGCPSPVPAGDPFQATGIKIGEVGANDAIVWARLTRAPGPVDDPVAQPIIEYLDPANDHWGPPTTATRTSWRGRARYPEGIDADTLDGAVPPAPGELRVRYRPQGAGAWATTTWRPVVRSRDATLQFHLERLVPGTSYELEVEARGGPGRAPSSSEHGAFRTAPAPEEAARVSFTVASCQQYDHQDHPGGFRIYEAMAALDPDFFVHAGDAVYLDFAAKNIDLARWEWNRMYSLPTIAAFHRGVGSYFMKDDHDTWMDECWPTRSTPFMGEFTFADGQALFREQVPMGNRTYRTRRWGRDLQIWLFEVRDFRTAPRVDDQDHNTIWGVDQMKWFKRTFQDSDATFRVLIHPTPLIGPDKPDKQDNHANEAYRREGNQILELLASQPNTVLVVGDRHWQYISEDPETGVREYSVGPASDEHATGWRQTDVQPEHVYLGVVGGFLSVTVDRDAEGPWLELVHHGVDGARLHEVTLRAESESGDHPGR